MVGDLGDFLLKQEEVGEQEREDLVMWLHQVSAINIHMHQPNPYHICMFIEDVVACMQSSLPLCSSEEERNLLQVCEEEAVQIEVFCLAVNCVDRSLYLLNDAQLPYPSPSLSFVPILFSFPQVLGPRPLKTQSVATFGQCLPHGRLEG